MKTSRERNAAAKAARIASWNKNKVQPITAEPIIPKNQPKPTALGYIGTYKEEPAVSVDETTGALTPAYQEAQ